LEGEGYVVKTTTEKEGHGVRRTTEDKN